MRVMAGVLGLFVLAWPAAGAAQTAIRPDVAIHLFDGKSLGAFYTWAVDSHREDPLRVFTVVDQVDGAPAIRISGEKWGGIITRESYGQWTRLEVIAHGDRITNIVNGKVVAEGFRSSLTEGKILIQSEGAEIYVRRIDLEPVGK